MLRGFVLAVALSLAAPAAFAQTLMAEYFTLISNTDRVNSRGARLTDFGAILQQDRANYHRFGRRDQLDQFDPLFGNATLRSEIPNMFISVMPGSEYVIGNVVSGRDQYLWIRVYGANGHPTQIVVSQGAG